MRLTIIYEVIIDVNYESSLLNFHKTEFDLKSPECLLKVIFHILKTLITMLLTTATIGNAVWCQ